MNDQQLAGFDYLQSEIHVLRALLIALAQSVPKEEFLQNAYAGLERLRVVALNLPTQEAHLDAIDRAEAYLKAIT